LLPSRSGIDACSLSIAQKRAVNLCVIRTG
jgi:hypothetical protein